MALSNSRPTHKEKQKILLLSREFFLIGVNIPNGPGKTLRCHDYELNRGCSFSPPIQNRFVYMVGGGSKDVYYYDLEEAGLYQSPSLCFRIWRPKLVLLGSKLFAFSRLGKSYSDPIAQFLDTHSDSWEWCPLQTRPKLPDPPPNDIGCYCVVAYASDSNSNDLFVSLGNGIHSFAHCYNDSEQKWSNFSETGLPFYGQGKFVGLFCYAFHKIDNKIDNSDYLVAYNLTIDWKTDAKVSCVKMCRYSLVSNSPYQTPSSYRHSFFAINQNIFTIVRTKAYRTSHHVKKHYLEVNIVELFPSPSEFQSFPPPFEQEFPPIQVSPCGYDIIESSSHARNSGQQETEPYYRSEGYGRKSISPPPFPFDQEFPPTPCGYPLYDIIESPSHAQDRCQQETEPYTSEGYGQVLIKKSISLPHALEEIIGEFYQ